MKISKAVELKGLQSQIEKEKNKLKLLEKEKIDISNQANECKQKINNINQKIKQLQDSNKYIIVSEHALLRYIERVICNTLSKRGYWELPPPKRITTIRPVCLC